MNVVDLISHLIAFSIVWAIAFGLNEYKNRKFNEMILSRNLDYASMVYTHKIQIAALETDVKNLKNAVEILTIKLADMKMREIEDKED